MKLLGIHHSAVQVSDLDRSRHFYEGLLGLEPLAIRADKPFDGIWYAVGHQQIHLIVSAHTLGAPVNTGYAGQRPHIALLVDDLTALKKKLEDWGCPVTTSQSGRPVVFIEDPDGNVLEVTEKP